MTDYQPYSLSPRPLSDAQRKAVDDLLNEQVTCPECRGKGYVPSFGTGLFRDHCVTCNGEGVL